MLKQPFRLLCLAAGFGLLIISCDLEVIPDDFTGGTGDNVRAIFHANMNSCMYCCSIQFTNNSQNAANYVWNFGDPGSGSNNSSSDQNPSHTYIKPGNYTVKLTALGSGSSMHDTTLLINITGELKTFAKYHGDQKGDKALDVCMTANEDGYIIVGGENTVFINGMYIIETDLDGTIVDTHSPGGTTAYAVTSTDDLGFVVAGTTDSGPFGSTDILVIRYDLNRVKVWEKHFGTAERDEARSIISRSNGEFVIAGITEDPDDFDDDIYILRINSSGNLIAENNFGGSEDDRAYDVIESGTGGFVIAGQTRPSSGSNFDAYVLKINTELSDIVWEKMYGSSNSLEIATSVLETEDMDYLFGGSSDSQIYIFKTDGNGEMDWSKTYESFSEGIVTSMVSSGDGNYVAVGENAGMDQDGMMMKIDPYENGTIIWSKIIEREIGYWDGALGITNTADCGFVVVGYQGDWPVWDAMMLKTDANGNYE